MVWILSHSASVSVMVRSWAKSVRSRPVLAAVSVFGIELLYHIVRQDEPSLGQLPGVLGLDGLYRYPIARPERAKPFTLLARRPHRAPHGVNLRRDRRLSAAEYVS